MGKILGIIGCGSVVQNMYLYSIPGWANIDKIYTYDIVPENASQVALALNAVVTGLENLVQQADIILITTPPHTHYNLLKQALLPGKTVICEKPFLYNYHEADEIINLGETNKAQLFVAHFRRILPAVQLAKNMLASGVFGSVEKIELFEGMRFSYKTQSGYETQNPFGGVLLDTGSHTLDQALFICGLDVENIEVNVAEIHRNKHEPSHEIEVSFTIKMHEKNIPVHLKLSRRQVLSNKLNIFCEHGILEVPTDLQNKVCVSGKQKPFLATADYEIGSYQQAFNLQYDFMFDGKRNTIFRAQKFKNLALIFDKILAYNA